MITIDMPCTEQPRFSQQLPVASPNIDAEVGQYLQVDKTLSASFSQLLRLYSMHLNKSGKPVVQSGGLQHFLIRQRQSNPTDETRMEQPRKGAGSDFTTVHDMPDNIILHIFAYLSAKDLCRISAVCRHWDAVSCDNILWRNKLNCDIFSWDVIGHMTNPDMYKECESDWSNKEIYLRCCPEVNQILRMQQESAAFHQISTMLRSFWPKKTPRLALFGPGLESTTHGIVRKIIYEENSIFQKVAMFPGKFGGLGAGFTLKMNNSLTFHLTTLYTATREARLAFRPEQRLQHNRMLAAEAGEAEGSPGETGYQLRPAMQDLCRTLDAFVFVVDASHDEDTVAYGRSELFAMVNTLWAAPEVPVMVLSCVRDTSHKRLSCVQVVRSLNLNQLNRPWQVRDCVVDGLMGISESLEWTVDMAQKT